MVAAIAATIRRIAMSPTLTATGPGKLGDVVTVALYSVGIGAGALAGFVGLLLAA